MDKENQDPKVGETMDAPEGGKKDGGDEPLVNGTNDDQGHNPE